jgi:hypothetical protein
MPRHGVTLEHGSFTARETVHSCTAGCRQEGAPVTRRCAALALRLPPKTSIGYDVMVFAGLARFVDYRQREEIRARLEREHGIVLSSGELSVLNRRFLVYLEALHQDRAGALREALAKEGGWPLHIDATGEDGQGAYAGWRGWALGDVTACLVDVRAQTTAQITRPLPSLQGPASTARRDGAQLGAAQF